MGILRQCSCLFVVVGRRSDCGQVGMCVINDPYVQTGLCVCGGGGGYSERYNSYIKNFLLAVPKDTIFSTHFLKNTFPEVYGCSAA